MYTGILLPRTSLLYSTQTGWHGEQGLAHGEHGFTHVEHDEHGFTQVLHDLTHGLAHDPQPLEHDVEVAATATDANITATSRTIITIAIFFMLPSLLNKRNSSGGMHPRYCRTELVHAEIGLR